MYCVERVHGADVVLSPGEAIAIPAFWFHHCEALELSVSLNVFTPSLVTRTASAALSGPLPSILREVATLLLSNGVLVATLLTDSAAVWLTLQLFGSLCTCFS